MTWRELLRLTAVHRVANRDYAGAYRMIRVMPPMVWRPSDYYFPKRVGPGIVASLTASQYALFVVLCIAASIEDLVRR